MLPWGDYNLQLYFRVVFICVCTAFTSRTPFFLPQTSRIVTYVAAFSSFKWRSLFFFCFLFFRVCVCVTSSIEGQTQRRSRFLRVFTPLSQLIFSLAGILTQRRPSCNTWAWQEFLRSHPAVAWPPARHTCQMKSQWRFSGNYSLLRSIVTLHISLETHTHTHAQQNILQNICQGICICQPVIVSM